MKKRRAHTFPNPKVEKRKLKKRIRTLQRRVFEGLDLPEELLPGVIKATFYGWERLLIENHRGVLEYGGERIRILTEAGVILITGSDLTLLEFGSERIDIRGCITGYVYEG